MNIPIIRWTYGIDSKESLSCLITSINYWEKIYDNRFRLLVCYNDISYKSLNTIKKLHVQLINQNEHLNSIQYLPKKTAWKLYPPRIDINTHEIFIDNDIILLKSLPIINTFLQSTNTFFISQAHKRFYGFYTSMVDKKFPNINSGIFGIPPNFNFANAINAIFKLFPQNEWTNYEDEQGVIALILSQHNTQIISIKDISICNPNKTFAPYTIGHYGVHFAGLNSGSVQYWKLFKKTINPTYF